MAFCTKLQWRPTDWRGAFTAVAPAGQHHPSSTIPPVQLVDNQETLLATSDLVFVDAIGTGCSQAIAPNTNQDFWGVDKNAAAFRDFVQRYVVVNQRAASPKFLFGESYDAPRTAVLSQLFMYTGLTTLTWRQNFDMGPGYYQQNAVPGQPVGRYDARVSAPPLELQPRRQAAAGYHPGPGASR